MKAKERFLLYFADSHLFLGLQLLETEASKHKGMEDMPLGLFGAEYVGFAREVYHEIFQDNGSESIVQMFKERQAHEARNLCLVEFPSEDGYDLVVRTFLLDAYCHSLCYLWIQNKDGVFHDFSVKYFNRFTDRLARSTEALMLLANNQLCIQFHLQKAVDRSWPYCLEFFIVSDFERTLLTRHDLPEFLHIQKEWLMTVRQVFHLTKLVGNESSANLPIGKVGKHTEYFMAFVKRVLERFDNHSVDLLAG